MIRELKNNYRLYLMEALGLGIFMISACFFAGLLESDDSFFHRVIPNSSVRLALMGVAMGATALVIFYSRITSPSGSHINPAVTLVQFRLGNITANNAMFYILFQFLGGTLAVFVMKWLMGNYLTKPPVNYVVTVPGQGVSYMTAAVYETVIAFIMITMVLFTSSNNKLKKYTRIFAACLVSVYVFVSGPVSGFGMNPARTFASAFPAGIYTAFWIYMVCPFVGMMGAAEFYLIIKKTKHK